MKLLTVDTSGGSTLALCGLCGFRVVRGRKEVARAALWHHVYEAHPERRRDAATMLGRLAGGR